MDNRRYRIVEIPPELMGRPPDPASWDSCAGFRESYLVWMPPQLRPALRMLSDYLVTALREGGVTHRLDDLIAGELHGLALDLRWSAGMAEYVAGHEEDPSLDADHEPPLVPVAKRAYGVLTDLAEEIERALPTAD